MILRKSILLMMVALVFWSCIEEDPNLVNAPPQSKTVRVRLINFADDKQDRKLVLDGKVETASVPFMSCSDAVQPPADSSNPSILKNGVEEYRSPRKIRFTKDNNYTVFAFPSMPIDTIPYKAVDTVIVVSTLSALPLREGYAYLRIINAVRDTNTTYQMRLGCPNGSMLGAVTYTKVSVQSEVSSENVAISILKSTPEKTELVGLYNLKLEEKKQYLLVVASDGLGGEKILLLDELSEKASFLEQYAESTSGLSTQMRCVNLSTSEQLFFKAPDKLITNGTIANIAPKSMSAYVSVQACNEGGALDTLAIMNGQDTSSIINTSLNISEKYTLLAIDSMGKSAGSLLLAEPYRMEPRGHALIRVVHSAFNRPNLTISVAGNSYSDTQDSLRFRAGDLIAQRLYPGTISQPIRVVPGNDIPITVFTSSEPAVLEYNALANLEKDKKYLLIVDYDANIKDYKLYLIDENSEISGDLVPLQKGVFAQFINLIPGLKISELSVSSILKNAKLHYGASIATVVAPGPQTLKINGKDTIINADLSERIFIIFAGNETNSDILVHNNKPSFVASNLYYRRYINASETTNLLNIKINRDNSETLPTVEALKYGASTNYDELKLAGNISLFFIDFTKAETIYRVDDLPFTFGQKYAIIFGGRAEDKSYYVVVQQEY